MVYFSIKNANFIISELDDLAFLSEKWGPKKGEKLGKKWSQKWTKKWAKKSNLVGCVFEVEIFGIFWSKRTSKIRAFFELKLVQSELNYFENRPKIVGFGAFLN